MCVSTELRVDKTQTRSHDVAHQALASFVKEACMLFVHFLLCLTSNGTLSFCRHLAAMKQRELENARVTAEEMEKQMAPLR